MKKEFFQNRLFNAAVGFSIFSKLKKLKAASLVFKKNKIKKFIKLIKNKPLDNSNEGIIVVN